MRLCRACRCVGPTPLQIDDRSDDLLVPGGIRWDGVMTDGQVQGRDGGLGRGEGPILAEDPELPGQGRVALDEELGLLGDGDLDRRLLHQQVTEVIAERSCQAEQGELLRLASRRIRQPGEGGMSRLPDQVQAHE